MFNFRVVNTKDGNQIIQEGIKTSYDSLSAVEMLEYMEIESRLNEMDRMNKARQKKKKPFAKLTNIVLGI